MTLFDRVKQTLLFALKSTIGPEIQYIAFRYERLDHVDVLICSYTELTADEREEYQNDIAAQLPGSCLTQVARNRACASACGGRTHALAHALKGNAVRRNLG